MPENRKKSLGELPEVFASNKDISDLVYRENKRGNLRKLASRIYTTNLSDNLEDVVKRNLWQLVAMLFPGALVADRTSIEHRPAADGSVFIISDKKRAITLPGININPRKGVAPLPSDRPFIGGLYLSSQARAFLENIRPSRSRSGKISRTLSPAELEEKLEELLRRSGEKALLNIRDEARILATELNLESESKNLDDLIGTMLGTRDAKLTSDAAIMRKSGTPYDPERLPIFQLLFETLAAEPPVIRLASPSQNTINLAFFEAYFSNFIEGTEFAVNEAEEIIFEGKIPEARPEDAHDILGTYRIVSSDKEMQRTPTSFEELVSLLKTRHTEVMECHENKLPGQFKAEANRAGSTQFVAPNMVEGTLKKGFELYQALEIPFARAVFMMFLIAEVHPFADGNGRIARIMMNAELVSSDEQRIIIPTVYRNNYLAGLKAISLSHKAEPLVRTLDFAQKYTGAINWQDLQVCHKMLESTHAFNDPNEADLMGIRLTMPS